MHKLIATGLGIGYIRKGSGTVAAAVCALVWYLAQAGGYPALVSYALTAMIVAVGVWSSGNVERYWGKDSNYVVIDEIAGMSISLLFLPVTLPVVLAAFVLFRFFDIVKPLYIRRAEQLPGGWGVMADDVAAGIYSNVLVQIAVRLQVF
jgi:phosphatidylglycerophosphatase A